MGKIMNKNIISLSLLFFALSISTGYADIPAISIDTNGNVGIGTETPETTLHVTGDTTLEGATYLTATYSTCEAIAGDPATNCKVQDMCGLSYMSGAKNSNPVCDLTYITTAATSTTPSSTTWSLSAVKKDCKAICVSFR